MKFNCPSCHLPYDLPEAELGRKVRCACGYSFVLHQDNLGGSHGLTDTVDMNGGSQGSIGQVGDYILEKALGKGAAGSVFLARHKTLRNEVAIKILNMKAGDNPDASRRFIREARLAAQLIHPNVVRILDCGTVKGNLYYVMECIEGGSLGDLLKKDKVLPISQVIQVGIDVCKALECAGDFGVVHRDIKPDNIMLADASSYKLADLGLARGEDSEDKEENPGLTSVRVGMGTPHFMPPEQAIDAHSADCRSDIYSLGVSLFQLSTGQLPFSGKNSKSVIRKHIHEKPPIPNELNPQIGEGVSNLILRAMMKNPNDRFQTPAEFRHFLESYALSGTSVINDVLPKPKFAYDLEGKKNIILFILVLVIIILSVLLSLT